jgi:DNA-directed RNA polymerase specialized sigma24 family protein
MAALTRVVPREDAALLEAFLAGETQARDELPRRMQGFLMQTARRFAPEATRTHVYNPEDIVQETFRLLLGKDAGAFDPAKGSVETFLTLLLRNAVKNVRASFAPPGRTTRAENDPKSGPRETVSLEAAVPGRKEKSRLTVAEVFADESMDVAAQFESREIIEKICHHVEAPVAAAIELFCSGEAETWTAAAEAVNMKRWTLSRRLAALATDSYVLQLAA